MYDCTGRSFHGGDGIMAELASLEPVRSTYRVVQVESCSSTSHFAIQNWHILHVPHRDASVKMHSPGRRNTSSWFVVVWAVA